METNIQQRKVQSNNDDQNQTSIPMFNQSMAQTVGAYMFNTGREKVQKTLNIYSHVDYLRPYFDVEPKDVLNRLLYSVVPIKNNDLTTELYGPLMILFTLCAIIIYQMKTANHTIEDGTLIGTAFFVCFTYWLGLSFLASSTSFVCNSTIGFINYLSLIGYGMFSYCVVLLVGTFIHTSFDHFIFYVLWVGLVGASGLKLANIVFTHTPHPNYKIGLAIGIFLVHMFFLLYIHFAYHELAEEVNHALFEKENQMNEPAKLMSTVSEGVKKLNKRLVDSVTTQTLTKMVNATLQ